MHLGTTFRITALAAALWLLACEQTTVGPPAPLNPVDTLAKADTTHKSDSAKTDTAGFPSLRGLDRWIPPKYSDSGWVGDFAPIAEGNVWIYHEIISPEENGFAPYPDSLEYGISQVTVRIRRIQTKDTVRLVTFTVERKAIRSDRVKTVLGKQWRWDDPPRDTTTRTVTQVQLEWRDFFYRQDDSGSWIPATDGFWFVYHRKPASQVTGCPDCPAPAHLEIIDGYNIYVAGLGLWRRDSLASIPPPISKTLRYHWILAIMNGRILNDSLAQDLTRPLQPRDPAMMNPTLSTIAATLPSDFCSAANLPPNPVGAQDLSGFSDLRNGNTWDYLLTSSTASHSAWYASSSSSGRALTRFRIDSTFQAGSCLIFSLSEADLLTRDTSYSSYPPTQTVTPSDSVVNKYQAVGIRRGNEFYQWKGYEDSVAIHIPQTGYIRMESTPWPFVSGTIQLNPGQTDSSRTAPLVRRMSSPNPSLLNGRVVYSLDSADAGSWRTTVGYKFAQGLGMVSAYINDNTFAPYATYNYKLELFRFNGVVVDDSVFQRFLEISK